MRDSRHGYSLQADLSTQASYRHVVDDASDLKMYPNLSKFLQHLDR